MCGSVFDNPDKDLPVGWDADAIQRAHNAWWHNWWLESRDDLARFTDGEGNKKDRQERMPVPRAGDAPAHRID